MEISVKQKVVTGITGLWCFFLALLVLGHDIRADEQYPNDANEQSESKSDSFAKDVNDPNELWWSKWDAIIKDPNDPNELLLAKWDAVIKVIQNKELEQNLKNKIIDKIVSPIFDSELMAKLVLGRTHWPKLTAAQSKKFTELFVERLKSFYLDKITLYKDEKVLFKPAMRNRSTILIPTLLISNDKEAAILYKLHKIDEQSKSSKNGCWKVYDVEVEGVSILLTYRSQFDDILSRGTIEDLLSELKKPPAP